MQVLFDGAVHVHYRFINVHHAGRDPGKKIKKEHRGQVNGLCGAAVPGVLSLVTGLHTGEVGFTVELHDSEPPLDDVWEEIVEVSFTATKKKQGLHSFDDQYAFTLPKGDYRVRYCARGMDAGDDLDTLLDGDPVDRYALQFWPGPAAPDRVLRQTSAAAAIRHRADRDRPSPSAALDEHFRRRFGGRLPNARLQALDDHLTGMLLIDRELVLTLSELDDEVLRRIARWSAGQALTTAGLTGHPAVAPAVAALRTGEPVPAPFDEELGWYSMTGEVTTLTRVPHLPGFRSAEDAAEPIQQWNALSSLNSVSGEDALQAAIGALESAAVAHGATGYVAFLDDLRTAFPALGPAGREPVSRP